MIVPKISLQHSKTRIPKEHKTCMTTQDSVSYPGRSKEKSLCDILYKAQHSTQFPLRISKQEFDKKNATR